MASLERLDIAKTRLQVSKEALHEADNWTVLAADIEEVNMHHFYFQRVQKGLTFTTMCFVMVHKAFDLFENVWKFF